MTSDELISALENATGPDRELDRAIALASGWMRKLCDSEPYWRYADYSWTRENIDHPPMFTASIDAALTLVPEDYTCTCGQNVHHKYWQASVNTLDVDGKPASIGSSPACKTPAISICIASLKARGAQR